MLDDRTEAEMLAAHKVGLRMFEIFLGNEERAEFYADEYQTEHEREAFMAGFKGAQRRSNGSKR
jgi:hypothetical protein